MSASRVQLVENPARSEDGYLRICESDYMTLGATVMTKWVYTPYQPATLFCLLTVHQPFRRGHKGQIWGTCGIYPEGYVLHPLLGPDDGAPEKWTWSSIEITSAKQNKIQRTGTVKTVLGTSWESKWPTSIIAGIIVFDHHSETTTGDPMLAELGENHHSNGD